MMTWPSDFTSSVVLATTWSPGLFLRASTGLSRTAWMVLPDCSWLAAATCLPLLEALADCEALAEFFESTCAPDLSADTVVLCDADALVCDAAEDCATAVPKSRVPATTE